MQKSTCGKSVACSLECATGRVIVLNRSNILRVKKRPNIKKTSQEDKVQTSDGGKSSVPPLAAKRGVLSPCHSAAIGKNTDLDETGPF